MNTNLLHLVRRRAPFMIAGAILFVFAMAMAGQVSAQAQPEGVDCYRKRCLIGLRKLSDDMRAGMLRVDAYDHAGGVSPSIRRVQSNSKRRTVGWVYRKDGGTRRVFVRDMRVIVASSPRPGWSRVRRDRRGSRWIHVRDAGQALEITSCHDRYDADGHISDATCSELRNSFSCTNIEPDVSDEHFSGLVYGAGEMNKCFEILFGVPEMHRDQLVSGAGKIVWNYGVKLAPGDTWDEQRVQLGVWTAAGATPDDTDLVCTLSLRDPVAESSAGRTRYRFSDVATDTSGNRIISVLEPGAHEIVLRNAHPDEPVQHHQMILLACGVTSDIDIAVGAYRPAPE